MFLRKAEGKREVSKKQNLIIFTRQCFLNVNNHNFLTSVPAPSLFPLFLCVSSLCDMQIRDVKLCYHSFPGAGGNIPGIPPDMPAFGPNKICMRTQTLMLLKTETE